MRKGVAVDVWDVEPHGAHLLEPEREKLSFLLLYSVWDPNPWDGAIRNLSFPPQLTQSRNSLKMCLEVCLQDDFRSCQVDSQD